MASEKRNFSGLSFSSKKSGQTDAPTGHMPTTSKLKNFFRLNNSPSNQTTINVEGLPTPKSESKNTKTSRFLPNIGRNRSTTIASEGNALDDTVSPTAHANPYFAHQGPPAIRHHNAGSVPPSPPDTPKVQVNGTATTNESAVVTGKEELARKLRRVASAPNTQGLFGTVKGQEDRPSSANLGKEPVVVETSQTVTEVAMVSKEEVKLPTQSDPGRLPLPGQIRQSIAFRRTYSSNSIKVRNVEVGPGSFDKIKLIGKGDVGKVYLVREKKSNRLYAMKGMFQFDGGGLG